MATDDELQATHVTEFSTLLDEEGVSSEEIKRLRGSISAFKGHLTRAYKDIRLLCSNSGPLSDIVSRKSALDDLFGRYAAAVRNLLQYLVDKEERDAIARCHRREVNEKALFDEEFTEWYNAAGQFVYAESARVSTPGVVSLEVPRRTLPELPREISRETPPYVPSRTPPELPLEIPRETPLYVPIRTSPEFPREAPRETPQNIPRRTSPGLRDETPPMTPHDVSRDALNTRLSQRRPVPSVNGQFLYGSRRSAGSGSKARLAVAQLKLKKIEEEQRLKEMELDLEKQRLQVEMERQLLNARVEVEQAHIELSGGSGDSGDISNRSSDLPSLPKQTLHETIHRFLASCHEDRPDPDPIPPLQPRKNLSNDVPDQPVGVVNAPEVQSILKVQQEAMKQHDEAVRLMVSGLERIEMPKREFLSFDGDPKRYPRFIKSFEINVERRVKEDDEKLAYLIQYCKGAAKDAIENCLMLPPEEGYKEAKEILRKNFGQKHIIVRAFIDKVVKGPQIRAWESEKLSQLARDMKSCSLNSDHMHYKTDINSMDTLKRIVMRLPPHLQAKWAEESNKLIEAQKEPEFSHLASFVEKRATVANTAFGKLVGARPEADIKPKFRRRPSVDPPTSATSLGIQSANGVRPQMARHSVSLPSVLLPKVQVIKLVPYPACSAMARITWKDASSSETRPLTNEKSSCRPRNCVPIA